MTRPRKLLTLLFLVASLATARSARADEAAELEKGRASYEGERFDEGATRFRELLDPARPDALKDPANIERARAYYVACLVALGRQVEAEKQVELMLRANLFYMPDPVVYPAKVIGMFADMRARLKDEIEKAEQKKREQEKAERQRQDKAQKERNRYIADLQRLAGEEKRVVRHSRWLALVPLGAGQLQNGQDGLGYALLVTEVLAGGTSIVSAVVHQSLVNDGVAAGTQLDPVLTDPRLDTAYHVNLYSTIAFAVLAVGGIVHAQLTFVPETIETRKRDVPRDPSLVPSASVSSSGAMLGLVGRF
jgi:hypothetical protein